MAIEAKLGRVGKVGGELEEERAKVLVAAVEVIDVDHGGGIDDPRNGPSRLQAFAGGPRDPHLLLSDADKDHPFLRFELAQLLFQDVIFALALLKADQLQALLLDEVCNGFDEALGHLDGLFGGGKTVAQIAATKGGNARLAGELGDVSVKIHAVDALKLQDDMIFLELGQAVSWFHSEFRLILCSPDYGAGAARGQCSGAFGGGAAQPDWWLGLLPGGDAGDGKMI